VTTSINAIREKTRGGAGGAYGRSFGSHDKGITAITGTIRPSGGFTDSLTQARRQLQAEYFIVLNMNFIFRKS
jgi:hypothetical protein